MPMTEDRRRQIHQALIQMEKQFGKGAVHQYGTGTVVPVSVISSGSVSLDAALGVGGFPRGRVIEIFGPESSGKTTLALHVVAEAQKGGGAAAFIDAEHALDPDYAKRLGVELDELLISQPDSGEQALEIAATMVATGAIDVVVVDSVAALVPKAELEGEMGDSHMGLQARLMSQALRKLTGAVAKTNCCLIFINQVREKIGVVFGNPETTTGGRALKFYSSVRIDIRRIGQIKDGEETIGNRTKATVVKNKCAPPFRKAEFDILFNKGINYLGDVLDLAVEHKVVDKSGSWLTYKGDRLGQGRDRALELLAGNAELVKTLESAVKVSAKTRASALETKTSVVPRPAAAPAAGGASGSGAASATGSPSASGATGSSAAGSAGAPRPAMSSASAGAAASNAPGGPVKKSPVPPGAPVTKS